MTVRALTQDLERVIGRGRRRRRVLGESLSRMMTRAMVLQSYTPHLILEISRVKVVHYLCVCACTCS